MSDPLGLVGRIGAGTSVQRPTPAGGQPLDPSQPTFKDVLLENIKQVNQLQQDATIAIEDLQTGNRTDVEGVILATQKADTAFRMLQSVRNKMMEAYEEIKQMRV
jgi:flagellar hook-basal body complex protein FliE